MHENLTTWQSIGNVLEMHLGHWIELTCDGLDP